jgi:hypothetical protein
MKWLPFLLLITALFGCKNKNEKQQAAPDNPGAISYNDTVNMPWPGMLGPDVDSGYFKGYIPEKIDSLEHADKKPLQQFLSGLISKKGIKLLNTETLSHSVLIDRKKQIRMDTLRNGQVTIISRYYFGKKETQTITVNGVELTKYKWDGAGSTREEVFDLDEGSFRYFSFKGQPFYYIQARSMYSSGSSMGNICYHFIFDPGKKGLGIFQSCRLYEMLFGDLNGDDNLDYLDFDNTDFCTTIPLSDSVTIRLYSCDEKGNFTVQKDRAGKEYFIQGNTGDDLSQDSFIVKRYHWPVPLK